jgi:O-antigen/teichoic acid export membrane protein
VVSSLWARIGGLWSALGVQKAAVLVFSFFVGRQMGADALGVMASVLAVSWLVGTVAGMGLPDHALFRGASQERSAFGRRLHGLFVLSVWSVHLLLWFLAPVIAGTTETELVYFSRGLILGAGAQCASALALGWLRGASQPRWETWATLLSAVVLMGGAWAGVSLGWVWAASGLVMFFFSMAGGLMVGGIGPQVPSIRDVAPILKAGLPYLCFGVGAWLLGNIDILLGRVAHPPEEVGVLQVGTMAVRGLGMIPWVAGTLMLQPLHEDWDAEHKPRPYRWAVMGMGVGVLVAAFALLVMPLLAQGHALPVSSVERSTWVACIFAPVLYPMILLAPIAAAWNLRATLKSFGFGLIVAVGTASQALDQPEVASCVLVGGTGQIITLMWLIRTLRSPRKESAPMDLGAVTPSERTGGLLGQSLELGQSIPLHSEE